MSSSESSLIHFRTIAGEAESEGKGVAVGEKNSLRERPVAPRKVFPQVTFSGRVRGVSGSSNSPLAANSIHLH
jgi:hypothetical protein